MLSAQVLPRARSVSKTLSTRQPIKLPHGVRKFFAANHGNSRSARQHRLNSSDIDFDHFLHCLEGATCGGFVGAGDGFN